MGNVNDSSHKKFSIFLFFANIYIKWMSIMFLNDTLEVYLKELASYVIESKKDKVYRLKKASYILKEAPRSHYKNIDSYFAK